MRVSLFVCLAIGLAASSAHADPLTDAKALTGHACPRLFNTGGNAFPGYAVPKGFVTVTLGEGWVFPMEKGDARRFAFLVTGLGESCKVNDVVALPDKAHANAWLQCHERDALIEGFGMRLAGRKEIVGWWTIGHGKLKPMTGTKGVLCQEPEVGD